MKAKIYALCGIMSLCAADVVFAQDVVNGTFEAWKTAAGSSYTSNNGLTETQRPGIEPEGWNSSSVNQFGVKKEMIAKGGEENDAHAVLTNNFVGFLSIGSNAPGYMTYGTPWVYASIMNIDASDGGTIGGAAFTYKPDALAVSFRRTFGSEDTGKAEKAHIIAYLWNGTFTSTISGNSPVEDADRAILGMSESTGDGKLIASVDYEISGEYADWQDVVIPLEYVTANSAETPSKVNIIMSSADYWTRSNIKAGNVLEVDDARFIYHSTLDGIKVNGVAIEGFSSDTYKYDINSTALPTAEQVEALTTSPFASAEVNIDESNTTVTITVTNQGGTDADGETSHTYTLTYIPSISTADILNGDFELWKEAAGNSYNSNNGLTESQRPGIEPEGWNGSSVNQMGIVEVEMVTKGGDDSDAHAVMTNKFAGFMTLGSNAPGYLTYGNPWVYANITDIQASDGGTFGGVGYGYKPDAIALSYKRTFGSEDTDKAEKAHIIAYLWNGTFTSTISGDTEVDNADRAILGMSESTGDGKLIASVDYEISGEYADWQEAVIPLEYVAGNSGETPTMMNIILSSADYWTRANIKADNVLEADDVRFVFHSTLSGITIDGQQLDGFAPDTYAYSITGNTLPTAEQVQATTTSPFANAEVSIDDNNNRVTITVTNQGGTDADGETSHTYTLTYIPSISTADILNGDFELWKEAAGNSYNSNNGLTESQRPGIEPEGWNGSSVNQFEIVKVEMVTKGGDESDAHVVMTNNFAGFGTLGSNAPGYLTYGNPWVYANIMDVQASDGGTFGGVGYGYKPDAIALNFKRTFGEEDADKAEKAHVIAYLWNGTFTSTISGDTEVDNADRAVLGMTESTGDGKLIAAVDYEISGEYADWQDVVIPLEYVADNSGETPTMMNIILSSADYWTRSNIKAGNVLEADNVNFVFYSTLNGIAIGGEQLEGFAPDTYSCDVKGQLPAQDEVTFTAASRFATTQVDIDAEAMTVTITVTNQGGRDADGQTSHTYTLTFDDGSGIDSTDGADGTLITAANGEVTVTTDEAVNVIISDLAGRNVVNATAQAGTTSYALPAGYYVVKAGDKVAKVFVD